MDRTIPKMTIYLKCLFIKQNHGFDFKLKFEIIYTCSDFRKVQSFKS